VISVAALFSLVGTVAATGFICYRLFNRKRYQAAPLRYNQSLILILNLLVADMQQALSFAFSLHWLRSDAILAPTTICNAQGWLVQVGDVSSGLFTLAIALQIFYIIVLQRKLEYKTFLWCIGGIWAFCLLISIVSPVLHSGEQLFVSAGAWCWISDKYHGEVSFVLSFRRAACGGADPSDPASSGPLPLDLLVRVRADAALLQFVSPVSRRVEPSPR